MLALESADAASAEEVAGAPTIGVGWAGAAVEVEFCATAAAAAAAYLIGGRGGGIVCREAGLTG
jgi:hypothetical protein